MDEQTVAIGLYCKTCQVQADIHFAFMDEGQMYIQGPCQQCGEVIKFSCDQLYISLISCPENKNKGQLQ